MIDAHCHLQEFENPGEVIAGLEAVICCGAGVESSRRATEIAQKYEKVFATVGVHPEEMNDGDEIELEKLARRPKVVAVGEAGLDYTNETTEEEKGRQRELFKINLRLGEKMRLPLVVHCRNAFDDIFKMVDYEKVQMHCFTGDMEQMQECVRRGWYVSFGGIITFKNSRGLREVAKAVPDDKLLIETDAPYLAPEPVRGSRNTPENVKIVAEFLAGLRSTSINQIDEVTSKNARQFFGI